MATTKKTTTATTTKYPLKAWNDPDWRRELTPTLTVSRVDEDIPGDEQTDARKPWSIALTQPPDVVSNVGGVENVPAGTTVLLSEDEVLALVRYLFEPQTVLWTDPAGSPTLAAARADLKRAGFKVYKQPGMLAIIDSDEEGVLDVVNGEDEWSPAYFAQQDTHIPEAVVVRPAAREPAVITFPPPFKVHTLPWKLPRRKRR